MNRIPEKSILIHENLFFMFSWFFKFGQYFLSVDFTPKWKINHYKNYESNNGKSDSLRCKRKKEKMNNFYESRRNCYFFHNFLILGQKYIGTKWEFIKL